MYADAALKKDNYYSSYIHAQFENGVLVGRTQAMKRQTIFIIVGLLAVIILLAFSYRQYRSKAKIKLQAERDKNNMNEQLHRAFLQQKEKQITMMRQFIINKVDIARKIEELKNSHGENISLTDADWDEINQFLENVDGDFVPRLKAKFPSLSNHDIQFLILVRFKMPTQVLASIYGISEKSIRQKLYVFKSKVGIEGQVTSLRSFIKAF